MGAIYIYPKSRNKWFIALVDGDSYGFDKGTAETYGPYKSRREALADLNKQLMLHEERLNK